jgi:hypothetical protein
VEPNPPHAHPQARKAVNWLGWWLVGLIPAGQGTLVTAPLAVRAAVQLLRQPTVFIDHRRAWIIKYYDESGATVISGPTQASDASYYFTFSYGAASLAAGAAWEFHTALRLNNWAGDFNGANDGWHTPGALPARNLDWPAVPAFVGGARVWGFDPGGPAAATTGTKRGFPPRST